MTARRRPRLASDVMSFPRVQGGGLGTAFNDDLAEHAGRHVVHQVTVEGPAPRRVDFHLGQDSRARRDADHVLDRVPLAVAVVQDGPHAVQRSEEHTSELQSLMRISYAVFCLKKKIDKYTRKTTQQTTNTSANTAV